MPSEPSVIHKCDQLTLAVIHICCFRLSLALRVVWSVDPAGIVPSVPSAIYKCGLLTFAVLCLAGSVVRGSSRYCAKCAKCDPQVWPARLCHFIIIIGCYALCTAGVVWSVGSAGIVPSAPSVIHKCGLLTLGVLTHPNCA